MPCVRQVCATRRHRMPPSDVPHETSAQLQWYYFIPAFNCSSFFIVQGYKECRHFFPFCSMFSAVLKTKLALCNFGFRIECLVLINVSANIAVAVFKVSIGSDFLIYCRYLLTMLHH